VNTRLARTSDSLISMGEDRPMMPPAATSRRAWRSRIRSMQLRDPLLILGRRSRPHQPAFCYDLSTIDCS
jgi:hypothetical protein